MRKGRHRTDEKGQEPIQATHCTALIATASLAVPTRAIMDLHALAVVVFLTVVRVFLRCTAFRLAEALALIAASPMLRHLCLHLVCSYTLSSLLYFSRSLVLASSVSSSADRIQWLSALHSYAAVVILALQLTTTGVLLLDACFMHPAGTVLA